MEQYIPKSALVAEIEKVIEEPTPSHDQQCPWEDGYYCGLYKAESIIDTLEVKEVDLEKECAKYYNNGYNQALEKACKWWNTVPDDTYGFNACKGFVERFKNYMQNEIQD